MSLYKSIRNVGTAAALSLLMTGAALGAEAPKDATAPTKAANDKLLSELPFDDQESFKNAHKGFIAPLPSTVLKGKAGNVIWDPEKYGFIKEGAPAPDTVNPSLWRRSPQS